MVIFDFFDNSKALLQNAKALFGFLFENSIHKFINDKTDAVSF